MIFLNYKSEVMPLMELKESHAIATVGCGYIIDDVIWPNHFVGKQKSMYSQEIKHANITKKRNKQLM